ncbi:hypothetical protein [Streptomyces sp. NPDC099088]|uniref:hypothetical protein n=1 Tax=Streptomyces sp. NPDC099088 TaxID=3366101 RepID=UPI0037F38D01
MKSAALTEDDVPGSLGVSADERKPARAKNTFPPASDATCQKMLDALDAPGASAAVDQVFNWKGSVWPGGGTLASYEGNGAEKAVAQVRASLTTCSGFKGVTYTGKYTAHVEGEKIPRLGDESTPSGSPSRSSSRPASAAASASPSGANNTCSSASATSPRTSRC